MQTLAVPSSSSTSTLHCVVCGAVSRPELASIAQVRSNVRRFAHESFDVWRCETCGSIHAASEVDLDHYYAHYPFHSQSMSFAMRMAFRNSLRMLTRLGLSPAHRLLDYGCGSGLLVQYLREQGFANARGYDPYAREGEHAEAPEPGFDFIISQDVIEHVADPAAYLRTLKGLAKAGGMLVIGTPDAACVDLTDVAQHIHVLHQPYHRHILSLGAMVKLACSLDLDVVEVKHGFMGNTSVPGLNERFLHRVLRANGDTLDDTLAGHLPMKWELFTPAAMWDAWTGGFRDQEQEMTIALRVPKSAM
jgi:2-polyprenyl-3-methyl-5-hydroxy-6-metoxy-1,4-benzoquinol methylase